MKIINKHIYADIFEKEVETQYTFKSDARYHTVSAYKVNIITEYDIILFGKTFHKTRTKELPFLFRTLEMAKDFCEINPKYKEVYFKSNESPLGNNSVKFYTYQLVANKEVIGYIWWNDETVYLNNGRHMEFKFNSKPIIYGFVENIKVKKWVDTNYLSDIVYYGFTDKLSDLVKTVNNNEKHWRFELIENKV